ncbi:MAG TPA: TetR family transcriptional regulator C-terminal domain-containing protein [Alphaproteobacteria bacterium]|nr:TetR family transcriptional regulator C-terminal domain-containing protein [Alphaproteobacteria bacterium]
MSQKTKAKLLDVGLDAVRQRGFAAVSIKDIVDAAGVPKGSFHYYFASKDAYALALMDHFGRRMAGVAAAITADPELSAAERLRRFFQAYAGRMAEEDHATGCLLGVMAAEAGDLAPAVRARAGAGLKAFASFLAPHIREAQEAGAIAGGIAPEALAGFLVDAWEGALLRMKAEGGDAALRDFEQVVFGALLRDGA